MSTISARVNWPEGQKLPSVDPNPILVPAADRDALITWELGTNVSSFQIIGLTTPEFSADASPGFVTTFSVTDANDDTTEYSYSVTATQQSTGLVARHDPKINNGST